MTPFDQLTLLTAGCVDLVSREALVARLSRKGRLRVKAGFDPTRPDLHLGHAVLLAKLRDFQRLGHEVVLVVGNFTAMIGDPSGKSKTRPSLTEAEVDAATETYAQQVFTILDRRQTDMVFNRNWLGSMKFADVVRLAGKYTLARMMERKDFSERWEAREPISLHELLYPLAQAQDSVHLDCDVEIGGTDQLFNLMVGRDLMRDAGQDPQVVMTMPILEGLSGDEKMSKSLGNYVGLTEPPFEQISKLMSVSDQRAHRYAGALRPLLGEDGIARYALQSNPKLAKLGLAEAVAAVFHGGDKAHEARDAWVKQFSKREQPETMPEVRVRFPDDCVACVAHALHAAEMVASKTEARRKIDEGAVYLDDARVLAWDMPVTEGSHVLKLGRRWARVIVEV